MGDYDNNYISKFTLVDYNNELREEVKQLTDLVKDLRGCGNCDYRKEFKDNLMTDLKEELTLQNIYNLIYALESQLCNDQLQRIVKKFKELNALRI